MLRFYASHTDDEGAQRSFQVMFYPGEQCVEVNEVSVCSDDGGGGGDDGDTSVYDAAVSCSVLL